ncbi:vesicular inhibitory amino acid transporter [Hydra vulgaris]|uniref:vesicular inhibitory amino acid transporter n=1 Tax=Hydra vulgaris TaxID=6087 RepID=UPI000192716D|nr:vesicular inhibitory amino acid transporter [Hydra vulgaris]
MWFSKPVFQEFVGNLKNTFDVMCSKTEDKEEDEGSTEFLLDGESIQNQSTHAKKVSNIQTFWNIFNANQGVVILSMPFVVLSGTYLSLMFTAFVAIISNYTSKKLVRCLYDTDSETGIEVRTRSSYEEIGEAFYGNIGKWMVYIAMLVEQLSYCTLLLILCGSILHSSFPNAPIQKFHWSLLAFVLVIPNAFMMNLGQVAFVSFLTVVIGQIVYVTVAVYAVYKSDDWKIHETPNWNVGQFFVSMGIVVVSYSSQPYMPAIEGSMKNKKDYGTVMNLTYFSITLVKVIFGLIGYLTFKEETKQVITNNLPHGPFKIIINVCVLTLALLSFTFPAYTVFVLFDKINLQNRWVNEKVNKLLSSNVLKNLADSEENILNASTVATNEESPKKKETPKISTENTAQEMSKWKRAVIRLSLIGIALAVAVLVPHFGLYMSFVGNFTGMCLSFIFPCLFHIKLKKLDKLEMIIDVIILIFGTFSAGAGMYFSTKALVDAYSEAD